MTPDIFDLVALAVAVVIAAYLMACEWAKDDNAEANRKNDKGDTSGLNHRQLLAWRLAELFVGLGLCFLVLLWTGSTMWYLLPLAGMAWGVFVPRHRYKLNKLRGKSWWYIVPLGNVYDSTWFRVRCAWKYRRWLNYNEVVACLALCEREKTLDWAKRQTSRAVYSFEAVVLALAVTSYTIMLCQ